MKYDLTTPCKDCPFLRGNDYLTANRVRGLRRDLVDGDGTFSCHKTNECVEGETRETEDSQHCAGAAILLEKIERPNQMMRIMERLGAYDRRELDYDADVYDDFGEMVEAHGE